MRRRRSLQGVLVAAVAVLVSGCEERSTTTVVTISAEKACELGTRAIKEDECESLCRNDDVDRCYLTASLSADACAKTADPPPTPPELYCEELRDELVNPFEGRAVEGRRPEGFKQVSRAVVDLGSYFASCHELEAASVDAFERLARELEAFGAPASLIARARRARQEEVRHAQWTAALARFHGAQVVAIPPSPLGVRTFFEMALENAVEGVVRETFGAAQALFRAATFPDPRAARVMERIAEDECGHAELSWDIAEFAWQRLSVSECVAIERAMRDELALLFRATNVDLSPLLHRDAGLPDRRAAAHLLETLRDELSMTMPRFSATVPLFSATA